MTEQTVGLPYVPEKNLAKEGIRKVGVGIFIVDLDSHEIWVVKEKKGKKGHNGTGREIGDLTIPMETRKKGESIISNVQGGLAEFRQLKQGEKLIWVDGHSYVGRHELVPHVEADIVILGLRNRISDNSSTTTVDSAEVDPVGWMPLDTLRAESQLRQGVASFLDLAINQNWIGKFVTAINNPSFRQRTVDSSLDLTQLFKSRELTSDIG
jgi:hypothetical protein